MSELTNTFAWSQSRDRVFEECHRQYFYRYYGSWGGWREDAPPAVRELYVLKNVQSRHMWIGALVHEVVAFALTFARQQRALPPVDDLITRFDTTMRDGFRDSRDDAFRTGGAKTTRLFEHEFPSDVPDREWKTLHARGISAIRSFVASDVTAAIMSVPPERWMALEELSSFVLDDVPVSVKMDFAYMDAADLRIVDWKTGARPSRANTTQLACYALYARERWGITLGRIRTAEVNLVRDEVTERTVDESDLDEAARHVWRRASVMRERLTDVAANEADEADFSRVEELRVCRRCSFQRVCLGGLADEVLASRPPDGGDAPAPW